MTEILDETEILGNIELLGAAVGVIDADPLDESVPRVVTVLIGLYVNTVVDEPDGILDIETNEVLLDETVVDLDLVGETDALFAGEAERVFCGVLLSDI